MSKWKDPIHPGEILGEELEFIGMNASELAERIGVPKNRLYQIVNGKRSVTADTAMRLAKFFGTTPKFWLNLQNSYELDLLSHEIDDSLQDITPYTPPAESMQPSLSMSG